MNGKKLISTILTLILLMACVSACRAAETSQAAESSQAAGQESVTDQAEAVPETDVDVATFDSRADTTSDPQHDTTSNLQPEPDRPQNNENAESEETETMLQMKIGNTAVAVDWEKNESVEALKDLCQEGPLTIQMSMYGGFEQVGSIGQSIPRNDRQTTTQSGDIVLYSGNQVVVFYGSNSWAYTRLGHIKDQSAQEMADLLGNGDVIITLEMGQ